MKKVVTTTQLKTVLSCNFFQSNIEGELVDKIQSSRNIQDGLIINAGGYTHTSVAIHDALKILKFPLLNCILVIFIIERTSDINLLLVKLLKELFVDLELKVTQCL